LKNYVISVVPNAPKSAAVTKFNCMNLLLHNHFEAMYSKILSCKSKTLKYPPKTVLGQFVFVQISHSNIWHFSFSLVISSHDSSEKQPKKKLNAWWNF
jgi:hypothetical protein